MILLFELALYQQQLSNSDPGPHTLRNIEVCPREAIRGDESRIHINAMLLTISINLSFADILPTDSSTLPNALSSASMLSFLA